MNRASRTRSKPGPSSSGTKRRVFTTSRNPDRGVTFPCMSDELTKLSADTRIVSGPEKLPDGSERWLIADAQGTHTMITSHSSAAAMDDAMVRFAEALARLAKL